MYNFVLTPTWQRVETGIREVGGRIVVIELLRMRRTLRITHIPQPLLRHLKPI